MKDAKGHGSNSRSTATAAGYSVVHKPPLGHFIQGPAGEHGPYFAERGAWKDAARLAETFKGKGQDQAAAAQLASGPKSAQAPVHDAMSGGRYAPDHPDSNTYQHKYNPESVNEAIKNSGRFGGGKIGGREARMIHSILKGRGK